MEIVNIIMGMIGVVGATAMILWGIAQCLLWLAIKLSDRDGYRDGKRCAPGVGWLKNRWSRRKTCKQLRHNIVPVEESPTTDVMGSVAERAANRKRFDELYIESSPGNFTLRDEVIDHLPIWEALSPEDDFNDRVASLPKAHVEPSEPWPTEQRQPAYAVGEQPAKEYHPETDAHAPAIGYLRVLDDEPLNEREALRQEAIAEENKRNLYRTMTPRRLASLEEKENNHWGVTCDLDEHVDFLEQRVITLEDKLKEMQDFLAVDTFPRVQNLESNALVSADQRWTMAKQLDDAFKLMNELLDRVDGLETAEKMTLHANPIKEPPISSTKAGVHYLPYETRLEMLEKKFRELDNAYPFNILDKEMRNHMRRFIRLEENDIMKERRLTEVEGKLQDAILVLYEGKKSVKDG